MPLEPFVAGRYPSLERTVLEISKRQGFQPGWPFVPRPRFMADSRYPESPWAIVFYDVIDPMADAINPETGEVNDEPE